MKAKDIINQLLESTSIKAGPFAKEIGVHPTQIYDLQSEKIKKISASIASKIVNRYPEYDPIWLLTGEGEIDIIHKLEDIAIKMNNQHDRLERLLFGVELNLITCNKIEPEKNNIHKTISLNKK